MSDNLSELLGRKGIDDNFFDRFVLLKVNTKEYIVKARVIR